MQCDEFEEQIHQSLDQRNAPWAHKSLLRHTQDCPHCRDLLSAYEQLTDGLGFFESPTLAEDFSRRVANQFSTVRSRRRYAFVATVIAALAAGVLLAVSPGLFSRRSPDDVASPSQTAPLKEEVDSAVADPRAGTFPDASTSPTQSDVDFEQVHMLWDQWATRLSADRWEPVDKFAGGFAPIAEPLSVAIEEIRSTIPLGRRKRQMEPPADSVDAWQLRAGAGTA